MLSSVPLQEVNRCVAFFADEPYNVSHDRLRSNAALGEATFGFVARRLQFGICVVKSAIIHAPERVKPEQDIRVLVHSANY